MSQKRSTFAFDLVKERKKINTKQKDMRKILILCIAALMTVSTMAVELSKEGSVHYKRAMSLLQIATLTDDYKKVASELEQVVLTDPDYADTYLQMSRVYRKIGATEGEAYFQKAEKCNNTFFRLAPTETDAFLTEFEAIAIDEGTYKGKKAAATLPLIGKWKFPTNPSTWYIEVTNNNGEYGVSVNTRERVSVTKVDDYTFDIQIFTHKKENARYEDDCSKDADPGYPKSGVYYYDEWRHTDYERVTLNGNAPHIKMYRQHTDYYLNGRISYKETHTNAWYFSDDDLVRF